MPEQWDLEKIFWLNFWIVTLIGFVLSNKRRNFMVSSEKIPRNCREQLTNSHHFFPWFSTPELVQLKQEKWWSLASWDLIKHIAIITKNLNMWRSQHLLSHFIWKINKNYLKQKLITINIQQLILSASNLYYRLFQSYSYHWGSNGQVVIVWIDIEYWSPAQVVSDIGAVQLAPTYVVHCNSLH